MPVSLSPLDVQMQMQLRLQRGAGWSDGSPEQCFTSKQWQVGEGLYYFRLVVVQALQREDQSEEQS